MRRISNLEVGAAARRQCRIDAVHQCNANKGYGRARNHVREIMPADDGRRRDHDDVDWQDKPSPGSERPDQPDAEQRGNDVELGKPTNDSWPKLGRRVNQPT